MSAPDRALEDLNLDEMPVTRSSTRSVGDRRAREQAHSGSHRMNPLARPTRGGTSRYSAESSRQGVQATQEFSHRTHYPGDFEVVNVKRINTTVDFTLVQAVTPSVGQSQLPVPQSMRPRVSNQQACVSIQHDPGTGDHKASCDFQGHISDPICVHILWLIGRLYVVLRKIKPTTAENVNQQVGQLYERMKDMTNNDLLECVRNEQINISLPSVKAEEQQARRANLCDILSSFDEDETPKTFLHHVLHNPPVSPSPGSLLAENDLPATIFRLAMRDNYIYAALHNMVPGDVRARKYYETQFSRAEEVIRSPGPVGQSVKDLRKIIHDMYEDRSERREQFPQDPQEAIDAILAEILMNVVGMVVNDQGSDQSGAEAPSRERLHDMYVHLISNPRRGTQSMEGWMKDIFVLDRYQELWNRNQERLNHRWPAIRQRWESIQRRIQETTTSEYNNASHYYASKIEEIIQELNGRPSDPSVNAQRIRMPQVDRSSEEDDEDEPL